ncbi:MAG: anti-sigma factor family protein [Acidobacteriota bacterium]
MTDTFQCDDKGTLVEYLYGEIADELRRDVEGHLRVCPACARELSTLQSLRHDLASWAPPEADLAFTIHPTPAAIVRPARWQRLREVPAWVQFAAAVLVIGAGASLANLNVRYGGEGLTVTTGWLRPASEASTGPVGEEWKPALVALEQDLRTELGQLRRAASPEVVNTSPDARTAPWDERALVKRVESLISASEQRQRQEMAFRLTQARSDWELQRRGDLVRIDQRLGSLQGRTFKAEAGQQEMLNLLRRVSAQPIP